LLLRAVAALGSVDAVDVVDAVAASLSPETASSTAPRPGTTGRAGRCCTQTLTPALCGPTPSTTPRPRPARQAERRCSAAGARCRDRDAVAAAPRPGGDGTALQDRSEASRPSCRGRSSSTGRRRGGTAIGTLRAHVAPRLGDAPSTASCPRLRSPPQPLLVKAATGQRDLGVPPCRRRRVPGPWDKRGGASGRRTRRKDSVAPELPA